MGIVVELMITFKRNPQAHTMQKPRHILNGNLEKKPFTIKVFGNADKTDGFIYYSFEFDEGTTLVISKFDGDQWKLANTISPDSLANALGKLLEQQDR